MTNDDESAPEDFELTAEGWRIELADLSRVALEPGDILLVRTDHVLSMADAEEIKGRLRQLFAGHRILIADKGLEFAVIRPLSRDDGDDDPRPQEV